MNIEAIKRAQLVMSNTQYQGTDEADLIDLLADLQQWCANKEWDWDYILGLAEVHAVTEMKSDFDASEAF